MFKPQLSEDIEKVNEPITFPKLASYKLDGIRVVTKHGSALTRSLKPVPNHHIRETLAPYANLDGEVIIGSPTDPDVYRNTNSAVMSHDGTPEFTYWVFDKLDSTGPLTSRLADLAGDPLPPFIKILPQHEIQSATALETFYSQALDLGYEGLIVRNPDSAYKHGRCTAKSQDSLKYKPFADSDAVVISVYEAMENQNEAFTNELGQTERSTHQENKVGKGMLGGFVVRDTKTGVVFDCAPGKLTHAERIALFQVKGDLVGKMLKYRHMPYGVKELPRFPRFYGWRSPLDV